MAANFYESDRALAEYLLFHYGDAATVLPYAFGPAGALGFAVRCVSECLEPDRLPAPARALELGCAVGRSSFELARHCDAVVGIDFSRAFIDAARTLQQRGELPFAIAEEGALTRPAIARVPPELDRQRVTFEPGDAQALRPGLGEFDVVLLANLIDRLREPRRCLRQLPDLVKPGGQLIVTSPYTWLEEYTPREHWLGGFERDGRPVTTSETLTELLAPHFSLARRKDLPFLIREHARKFQWSVAEATVWVRRA